MGRPKKKVPDTDRKTRTILPAMDPTMREQQLIALAIDRAEEKLLDGTASNQLILHFLKLGTEREKLEREKLESENELLRAKTNAIESDKNLDGLYRDVIASIMSYRGDDNEDDEYD